MNIGWNIESFIHISGIFLSIIIIIYLFKINWRRYGVLFILSAIVGNILCYIFVKVGFYSYPYRLFPNISIMPFTTITTVFPALILISVRFSPEKWSWKIPYYWAIVHLGVLGETIGLLYTDIIEYNFKWDLWDSYTWWWIYVLIFEWIGSIIISKEDRCPLDANHLKFGRLGWAIVHFILIVTIFLGGFYLGVNVS
ncbi:hypothetical protein CIB95_00605 [Lottiidibacillus patelloidae]|uniref:Uncharacterized protein n=1 Tax=Lottiidibacillus patelloidae TaxID=2670334 RepID=A0A263BWK1_9BACI|nr:CBO0543 family protein [Lottiidibacillus patelloidae]OZM58113.1 hypothetical protein CIB95_00605 [Lottiidibacillus patelloidae]